MAKNVAASSIASRRGRTVGIAVFALIMTTFTAVCSVQIILQAWGVGSPPAGVACRAGVAGLVHAVRRAREAAARGTPGERETLARFREALAPEWQARSGLSAACRDDADALAALSDVDVFRYAEERTLRFEREEALGPRQRVDAWMRRLSPGTPETAAPSPPESQ